MTNKTTVGQKRSIDDAWFMVREFQIAMGEPAPEIPHALISKRRDLRASWMREEIEEFRFSDDIVKQVDSLIDLVYFAFGTLCEMGVPPKVAFEAVHAANMRKLGPDGKPQFDRNGKIVKPEAWLGPELEIEDYIQRLGRAR